MARGRTQAAAEAWARVKPGSPFAPPAILGNMQIQMERGQLRRGGADHQRCTGRSSASTDRACRSCSGPIYCQQGRLDETLRLIEMRWEALEPGGRRSFGAGDQSGSGTHRSPTEPDPYRCRLAPSSIRPGGWQPSDDRIWLGKANLAIRVGLVRRGRDAGSMLCLRRRPDDASVWRGRLDWAVGSNRVAEAREAVRHLPADVSPGPDPQAGGLVCQAPR